MASSHSVGINESGHVKKRVHLSFFETACKGSHVSAGQWRSSGDNSYNKDRLPYYLWLAQLAEKGKITCIFFADSYAGREVYGGTMDTMFRAGTQVAQLDPLVIIPAMAACTKSVSFGVTASTTYIRPYILARTYSTLDHLTNGRVAWNIVTSYSDAAAKALGENEVVPHDERYAIADEYMDVVYKLWESSWADDACLWDKKAGVAYDPSKIKKIEHKGQYFRMSGRSQVHPSPQRTPFLFQAGTSKAGSAFSGKHAEAVFIGGLTPAQAAQPIKQTREAAAANGRDPSALKFFVGISPIIGKTVKEAQAKYQLAQDNADILGGLSQFSGYTGIDLSSYPLDEPLELPNSPSANAVQSILKNFSDSSSRDEPWTPRRLGLKYAVGGFHPTPVGTPEMIADHFEQWIREADVDGFNIAYVSNPGSFEDVVDLLVPELVRRGLMWEDYAVPGGTFRENIYGAGQSRLRNDHYGHSFRWKKE